MCCHVEISLELTWKLDDSDSWKTAVDTALGSISRKDCKLHQAAAGGMRIENW